MRCITLLLSLALLGSCAGRTSETAAPAITGTATYRERMMLPPGAVLEVRLEDVSRADTAADLIASTTVTLSGGPPYSFSLAYPHDKINAKNRYALRGRITSEGGLMFTSDSGYPVLGPESIAKVDLVLRRVEAEASPDSPAAIK